MAVLLVACLASCDRSGILLSEAKKMDGAGTETHCLDCLQAMSQVPRYQADYASGNDSILGVISELGYTKMVLDSHRQCVI